MWGAQPSSAAPGLWAALTVHGHLVDLGGVVLLDVPQDADVVVLHKVDGDAFPAVPARAADSAEQEGRGNGATVGGAPPAPRPVGSLPVYVELSVVGQVIVNDQRHLRHIQASSPNVCGNKNSAAKRRAQLGFIWKLPVSRASPAIPRSPLPQHTSSIHTSAEQKAVSRTITKLQSRQDQYSLDLSEGIMLPSVKNTEDGAQTFFP